MKMMDSNKNGNGDKKYWRRLYIIVVAFLLIQIVFYYLITAHFS